MDGKPEAVGFLESMVKGFAWELIPIAAKAIPNGSGLI
jgi:hypothetical protein